MSEEEKEFESRLIFGYREPNMLRVLWGNPEDSESAELLFEIEDTELMNIEKERLGFSKDELVFIGISNLSNYYWCGWQYFLKAQREELMFFMSYFVDRLEYSIELGLIKKPPKDIKKLLKVGDKIKFSDIERLLEKRAKKVINLDPSFFESYKIASDTHPFIKGTIYELIKAEKYPSIRWNFTYKNIVLVGIPDGITKEFVYEFKYTRKCSYIKQTLIKATMQADVYGLFFQRPKRRVQIFCEEKDKIYTYVDPINKQRVIDLLEKWIDMKNGKLPKKPKSWKCNNCEFRNNCVLLNT